MVVVRMIPITAAAIPTEATTEISRKVQAHTAHRRLAGATNRITAPVTRIPGPTKAVRKTAAIPTGSLLLTRAALTIPTAITVLLTMAHRMAALTKPTGIFSTGLAIR